MKNVCWNRLAHRVIFVVLGYAPPLRIPAPVLAQFTTARLSGTSPELSNLG
jgi:hypothetical protein